MTPKAKALITLQKLVRLESADDNGYCQCVSCGKSFHWTEGDGGHYISKGCSSYWALKKENVHPQCKGCNGFGMKHGTAANQYTLWMVDYYGRDFVDQMEADKRKPIKIYKKEYQEMIEEWNQQIREHLARIGG
jgi:hypothetical protein